MKPKPEQDKDELNLIKLAQEYSDDDKARGLLESLRWPNGAICPHCKNDGKGKTISKLEPQKGSKSAVRKGVYFCGACRQQFSVTVGTVFEGSHVPIGKWLMAMFLICSSKKSISSNQLHRMLGVQYKTAWFMAHRIRFAMGDDPKNLRLLKDVVECDETFIGGKFDPSKLMRTKIPLVALVERGGEARTRIIATVTSKNLGACLHKYVSKDAIVNTDEHPGYKQAGKDFKRHDSVNHSKKEYSRRNADGTVSGVNHCESFFSLLKRGIVGSWHHVSPEHLAKYSDEFCFRWNTRHVTDGERMEKFVPLIEGKRLTYREAA